MAKHFNENAKQVNFQKWTKVLGRLVATGPTAMDQGVRCREFSEGRRQTCKIYLQKYLESEHRLCAPVICRNRCLGFEVLEKRM